MTTRSPWLLIAAVAAGPAGAAEPRKPTARWVVNYDDAQCVASRNYGTEDKPLFLAFKPSANGSVMRIMLMGDGSAGKADERPASLRFGDKAPIALSALVYGDPITKRHVTSFNVPMAVFAANRGAATISIKAGSVDERLAVPGISGASAGLDDCLANLRDVWNVGSPFAERLKKAARPSAPLASLFNSSLYPTHALNEGKSGTVGVSMLIDEAGRVRDCMIEETSGFATLDTMSCLVITSDAKFSPALGPDGKPAKSAHSQRIDWRLHRGIKPGQALPTAAREPVAKDEVRNLPPQ